MAKKVKLLTRREIAKLEKNFPQWKLDAKKTKLTRTFTFEKQIDALIFIARTTVNGEILTHHPDVHFTYLKVKMTVTTHEMKGLTKQDGSLLKRIDAMYTTQEVDKE